VDAAEHDSIRVIAAANGYIDPDELAGFEGCGVGPFCSDAADGAGADDEGGGVGVLAVAVVDIARVGDDVGDYDLDYDATRAGLWGSDGLDCWWFFCGGEDEGSMGFGKLWRRHVVEICCLRLELMIFGLDIIFASLEQSLNKFEEHICTPPKDHHFFAMSDFSCFQMQFR
jgi:hypothetical protein